MTDPIREKRLVEAVEAHFAGEGPRAREVIEVHDDDGLLRFRLGGLFLECVACGMRVPQSRSRQSSDARRTWVALHSTCRATRDES